MKAKYKIALIFSCFVSYGQLSYATGKDYYPNCHVYILNTYSYVCHCDKTSDPPGLHSLKVTLDGKESGEIDANNKVPIDLSAVINIDNYKIDNSGFILDNSNNRKGITIKATINHFGRKSNDKKAEINETESLKVGKNVYGTYTDTKGCGAGTHTETYNLTVYAYVDLPPHFDIVDKKNNDKYSAEKPLKLKLNNFYVNERTQCTLQYRVERGVWTDLGKNKYQGIIAPNETISVYCSDFGGNVLGKQIYIRIKKETKIGETTCITYSHSNDDCPKIIFLNTIPDFSFKAYILNQTEDEDQNQIKSTVKLYVSKIDIKKYKYVASYENFDGGQIYPLDGVSYTQKDNLFIYAPITITTSINKNHEFKLKQQTNDGNPLPVNEYLSIPQEKVINLKTLQNCSKESSATAKQSPTQYDVTGFDEPYVYLKFTDTKFHIPYTIERTSHGGGNTHYDVGLSSLEYKDDATFSKKLNECYQDESLVKDLYILRQKSNWYNNYKNTKQYYGRIEEIPDIESTPITNISNEIFTHIVENDNKITAYIFEFSNATHIPGANTPQYTITVIDGLPKYYNSEITINNSSEAHCEGSTTNYYLTADDISIYESGGTLYFRSCINEGFGNNLTSVGQSIPNPMTLSFRIPEDINDYYSYVTGNGDSLIVKGKLNPIDSKSKIYRMDLTGKSREYLRGYICGLVDEDSECAYYDGNSIIYQGKSAYVGSIDSIVYAGYDYKTTGMYYVIYKKGDDNYRQYMYEDLSENDLKNKLIKEKEKYYNSDNKNGYKLKGIITNRKESYKLTDAVDMTSDFEVIAYADYFKNQSGHTSKIGEAQILNSVNGYLDNEGNYKYKIGLQYIDMGHIKYNNVKYDGDQNDSDDGAVYHETTLDGNKKIERNSTNDTIKELSSPFGTLSFNRYPDIKNQNYTDKISVKYGKNVQQLETESTISRPSNASFNFITPTSKVVYCDHDGTSNDFVTIIVYFNSGTTSAVYLDYYDSKGIKHKDTPPSEPIIYVKDQKWGYCIFDELKDVVKYRPRIIGNVSFKEEPYISINSETPRFSISPDSTNATEMGNTGLGTITITASNVMQDIVWEGDLINPTYDGDNYSILKMSNLPANTYNVTATQGSCTLSSTVHIEAPAVVGNISIHQSNDTLYYSASGILGNDLVKKNANGESDCYPVIIKGKNSHTITTDKQFIKLGNAKANDGEYKIDLNYKHNDDTEYKTWNLGSFKILNNNLTTINKVKENIVEKEYDLAHDTIYTIPYCYEKSLKLELKPTNNYPNFQVKVVENQKEIQKDGIDNTYELCEIPNSELPNTNSVNYKLSCGEDTGKTDGINANNPNTSLQLNNANNIYKSSHFDISFSRSKDYVKGNLDKYHIYPLTAEIKYNDFLCSYSKQADIEITEIKGGFKGEDEEQFKGDNWRKGDETEELHYEISYSGSDDHKHVFPANGKIENRSGKSYTCYFPGTYTVNIYDVITVDKIEHKCAARQIGSKIITRPLEIEFTQFVPTDPICELTANGEFEVEVNGGLINNKGYRFYIDTVYSGHDWDKSINDYGKLLNWPKAMDSVTYEQKGKSVQPVSFKKLYPGIYKTIVLDSNNCVQTRTDTLRQYHNPYVTAAHYDSVWCYGEKNGHIVIDKVTGSYPVTSFQLYKYNNDSVYVRDTNGIIVNSLAKNISTKITSDDRIWEYNADSAFVLIDSLYAGNYWIALTDTNKCSTPVVKRDLPFGEKSGKHFNIPVRQPDSLILSINDENNIIREYGKPGGSVNVNVSGGNKGTFNIFLDTKKDTLTQVIWGNHAFNDIFTPGTHKLYVTDHKECIDSATTKLMRQPDSPLSIEATPHDALCNGSFGSITVRGSGGWNGYQYSCSSKSNLYGANQNEYTFYDIKGGYYEVSVTDAEGVTATQKVYVNTPPKLMAVPLLRASSCKNDGLISANITGGTMPYLVKPDSSSVTPFYFEPYITNSNLTIIPKQLAAGDYSIVVVDSNNCEILMSATIADSSVKATVKPVYPTAHEFANGRLEAVVQQGPAPYTYQWKNHNTGQTCTNAVWDKVGAGVYSLEVTDANNCSVSVPITYLATNGDLPLIIDTIIGETAVGACNGMASFTSDTTGFKSITLHGNSGVEKDITSMVNNKLQFELTGLAPDSYLLECVLADTTVRYAKFTIARYEPMHLIVSNIVDVSKQDAANGSAKLRIDGGRAPFIVQMLRGDDFLADTVLNDRNLPMSGLTAANYTVSVVDESDNRINTQFIIRKPEKPLRLQAQSVENPSCNGYTNGRIILKATGGWGDYEYAAAEGEFGRATAYDGRGAAVHTFVAIDSKGTTDTLKVELVEPLPLTASVVQVDSVSCFGLTDGSVTFDIAGGTAPYTVHYDDFFDKKSNFVGSLNAGTHTFNITDSNFCRAVEGSLAVDIPQPDVLQVARDSVVHTTCNTDNGRIFITIAGGTAPYANSWREDGLIKERFSNLTAIDSLQGYSLYEVEVADAKGCKTGKSYRINPSSGPKIERVRTLPVLCHGDSTGTAIIDSADIVPATPYSPFRIEWPHGENAMSVGNLPAGRNVVFVIDSNNCKNSTSFNIDAPSPIEIRKIGSRDASCYGYADGRISTLALGGVGGYRYLWSNGDTLPDIDSIAKGAYTIVVADRNNCHDTATFSISQPDSLHVEIGEENVLMCPDNTYEFIPTDGFKTYRWILNDSTLSDKRNLIASEQGEYHLVATYGANCISRDTVTITIGDDLLEADFYMASDASKDNTIALVELSNMKTDSIRWDFSAADFEVMDSSLYELQLKPNTIGLHNITLWAYSSGCVSYITKQVEISELPDTTDNIQLGYDPLIKSVTVKPNPTNGLFGVDVQLRESHDAEMTISSVSHGTQIEQRKLAGDAEYSESFDLSNASDGVYILRISASDEHRVLKVLIAK